MLDILSHQGNANQNNSEIPPHTSQNGKKTQGIADAFEDMEKEEHFAIVGGIASWYNYSGV